MRTSGPLRPSGRRLASTSSGGSALGVPSSARTCSATVTDHFTARRLPRRRRWVRRRTSRRRPSRNPVRRRRAGPSRSPRCARAHRPSGVLARITASSAACSTATHTDVSAWQTSVTSSMPSRSADAIRASSRRRSVRAAAIARTGSACRAAEATKRPRHPVGLDVEQLGPGRARRRTAGSPRGPASAGPARTPTCPAPASAAWPPRPRRAAWPGYHRWSASSSLIRR